MKMKYCPVCKKPISPWKVKSQFKCSHCDKPLTSNTTMASIIALTVGGLIGSLFGFAICGGFSLCAFFIDTGIALLIFGLLYPYIVELEDS